MTSNFHNDCIFCSIVSGDISSSIVYKDDYVIAFMDISPINQGHLLVIPKNHYVYLSDVPEKIAARMFTVGQKLANAIRKSDVKCEGINFFLADGEAAFQEVFHSHLHVFPRFKGDSFKIDADWSVNPSRTELDEIAKRICSSM
ncbi:MULTISPECIES: HIT family protein [Metabacillus]|uniref:HIT family protein n=1 Tax=Metabacillus hrfriensis TaxID=3048891 RepID=A0ACD4RHK2_9BACI|nr:MULTISPECIES: HIT family protein [Metabacillus]UAL54385.1 HIT family protein [Metabacillus dongyingensis]USK30700.1 HIT family protein [Bacillus sp. CMF21]WHZ59951.1 HIT family protein [Metabacillus sp. CT-WN-B3]